MTEPHDRSAFVQLNRTFHEIAKDADGDYSVDLTHAFSAGSRLSWDDILKGARTIILSEAGTGKTEEIRQLTKQLRAQGKNAFFLRLEHIPEDFEDAFEEGSFADFTAWLSTSDEAFLFLDSVDEARLRSPGDFERAVRKLGRHIQTVIDRTRIILTGRASAWRPKTDLALCEQQFPITPRRVQVAEPEQPEDADVSDPITSSSVAIRSSNDKDVTARFRVVALDDLSIAQITVFAESKGVTNTKDFIEEIDRKDAGSFATRPQDLEELIEFWTKEHRIGSRLESMRNSVERRLQERDQNQRVAHPLSPQQARQGARLLAAASLLGREPTIQVPDGAHSNKGIPVQAILPDWNDRDQLTLLSRPIFDEAIYGTVRFHHRSVREFLVAEWLSELLSRPASRREIEALLFREQYGVEVPIPTMRPVLPWLALFDEHIRDRILHIAPEILFEGGDPSSLPLPTRKAILAEVCRDLAAGISGRSALDYAAVQRFASPEISEDIKELLGTYSSNEELVTFLVRMIWLGRLTSLIGEAKALAQDPERSKYTRIAAIRALKATGSEQDLADLRASILLEGTLNRDVLGEIIAHTVPTSATVAWLLNAIDKAEPKKRFSVDGLTDSVENFVLSAPMGDLSMLARELNERLGRPPHIEGRYCEVSLERAWLIKPAAIAAERLIRDRSTDALQPDVLGILRKVKTFRHWDDNAKDSEALFETLVPQWTELNRAAFWNDVRSTRTTHFNSGDNRLTNFWQASAFGSFWSFGDDDFDYAADAITSSPDQDDKLVALTLAFQICTGTPNAIRKQKLQDCAGGNSELEERLTNLLNPPPSEYAGEQRKWKRRAAAEEKRKRENEAKWKEYILSHTEELRAPNLGQPADISSTQWYLHGRLRTESGQSNDWTAGRWRKLIPVYGEGTAQAYRDGVVNYWRKYRPILQSEGAEKNSTPNRAIFGLTGLEIEASETSNWPKYLSTDEVLLASRYATYELNGFPDWFPRLYEEHPDTVAAFLLKEVQAEISSELPDVESHYLLSDVCWSGKWAWDRLAPDLFATLEQHDGKNVYSLNKLLTIVQGSSTVADGELAATAKRKAQEASNLSLSAIWYAAWVGADADNAIPAVTNHLASIKDPADQTTFAMTLIARIWGGRRSVSVGTRRSFLTPNHLKKLFLLTLTYVREEDDIDRIGGGVYSPELRDEAQDARNALYEYLTKIPGKEAFIALDEISREHPRAGSRPWLVTHARKKAELDADIAIWSPTQVRDFHEHLDRTPSNHRELAELAIMRLLDLKDDLENGDDSVANVLRRVQEEPEMRNFLAHELREKSHGRYTITQEEEFADGKRPDLRFHGAGFDAPVPAELKLADRWTGPKLIERLENQLSGDYLRDNRSARGIFVLVNLDTKTHWQLPASPQTDFPELVSKLQEHWKAISGQHPHVEEIIVVGIDLAKRTT